MYPAGARTRTARSGVERTNHEVTDLKWVVLNLTGAEVQNERREQGGMISAKKTKPHHCYLTNFKELLILTT